MILIARLLILMTMFSFAGCMGGIDSEPTTNAVTQEFVTSVIDGDTVELASGERVRYIGIDTPETHHPDKPVECYGERATERNRELVEGKEVELVSEGENRDQYGRLLRHVFVDGTFVNSQMIWEGFARARSFGEPSKFHQVFVQMEVVARDAERGLWNTCP
jgi:micrococcal nuclease